MQMKGELEVVTLLLLMLEWVDTEHLDVVNDCLSDSLDLRDDGCLRVLFSDLAFFCMTKLLQPSFIQTIQPVEFWQEISWAES